MQVVVVMSQDPGYADKKVKIPLVNIDNPADQAQLDITIVGGGDKCQTSEDGLCLVAATDDVLSAGRAGRRWAGVGRRS